jgi:hypothetical protein
MLESSFVAKALVLLEGRSLGAEEAQTLARVIGSREELLAHLLICRSSFASYPRLSEAIERAARAASLVQKTKRPEQLDAVRRQAAYQELETALGSLLTGISRRRQSKVLARAEDAVREYLQQNLVEP